MKCPECNREMKAVVVVKTAEIVWDCDCCQSVREESKKDWPDSGDTTHMG